MAESSAHMEYVNLLNTFVETLVPSKYIPLIYLDNPDRPLKPPRTTNNFTPDLFYSNEGLLVIGEAKTAEDVDRAHSIDQYEDYYHDAINYDGKALIVLCVPWHRMSTVKNIMRRIKKKYDKAIDVYVISELNAEKI